MMMKLLFFLQLLEAELVVKVQKEDFDIADELKLLNLKKNNSGGCVIFIGKVREKNNDLIIKSLEIEHYPIMTEKQLETIELEALNKWPINSSLIIHRYGKLFPGDNIVLVMTSSAHRKTSFKATEFIVEKLKTKATFWKLEETLNKKYWLKPEKN